MKKVTLIALALLLLQALPYSQWQQIATIGNNELRAVKFLNEQTGIVAGIGGVWRSTDSGINWTQTLSGRTMNAVAFLDFNNGTAVGDSGSVFKTTNNGNSWFQEAILTTNDLYTVSYPTTNYRFALGENGTFLRCFINTWSLISTFGYDVYDVKMLSANTGYVVGSQNNEVVRSTVNGGANWFTALSSNGRLNSIHCFTTTTIIAVGNNSKVRISTNSGLAWTVQTIPGGYTFNCVTFPTNDTGFICGDNGTVFRTINIGTNWSAQISNTNSSLKSLSFINSKTGWATGSNGTVIKTTTGGIVGISTTHTEIPEGWKLYQNYPNPFNPTTTIQFYINEPSYVKISVFDITGKAVSLLINQIINQGNQTAIFENRSLTSGVYFYSMQISIDNKIIFEDTKKMLLIK